MTTPVVDFVRQYAQSGTARLHMPGHKGQSLLGCEPWDITEIRGADELYEAEGIIAQSEANATRLFGTAHTYYSTEGSSQCIRAMLCLALQGAPRTGKRPALLAARNAHKALLYAAALLDFDIRWLWPAPDAAGGYRFSKAMKNPGFLGVEAIRDRYLPLGFSQFKLEGRGLGSALILEFLLFYLTKPDYHIHVREALYLDNMLDLF